MSTKYNLHLGKLIHQSVLALKGETIGTVAEKLGITRSALDQRFRIPHYGTPYELVEISIVVGINFIEPLMTVIAEKGLPYTKSYTKSEVDQLKHEISALREDNTLYKATIKKLIEGNNGSIKA